MPTTKLTLSADRDLVRRAKELARSRGTTLSALFDRYMRSLVREGGGDEPLGAVTRQAVGLVSLPHDRDDRELLSEALAERERR